VFLSELAGYCSLLSGAEINNRMINLMALSEIQVDKLTTELLYG